MYEPFEFLKDGTVPLIFLKDGTVPLFFLKDGTVPLIFNYSIICYFMLSCTMFRIVSSYLLLIVDV